MTARLRLGTRGSPLAMKQAEEARDRLAAAWPELAAPGAIELVEIRTTGDRVQDRPLAELGGKGLFAKEIEEALQDRRIDVAVHSLKDLPTWLPPGLILAAVLPREDHRDALVTLDGLNDLRALPAGAVVGTCSLRRQAQLLMQRPDLEVVTLRGNVGTRLKRLAEGSCRATLLAVAGLRRLGLAERGRPLPAEQMLPAVAQGAIGLEIRADDAATARLLAGVNHAATWDRVACERACLAALRGACTTPVAVLAEIIGSGLKLRALLALPDGSQPLFVEQAGALADGLALGTAVGAELRRRAGPEHLALLEA
jgi:hydroxymethylbilane synthase